MSLKEDGRVCILEGERLKLRTLQLSDSSEKYLSWLNDQEVQKFTRRRGRTSSMEDVADFIDYTLKSADFHFAIFLKDTCLHIGNVSLNSVDELNKSAEISIMIGDKTTWGKGYGSEAINLLTDFAFKDLKLHRVWAESCNPGFIALMRKLKWRQEGVRQDAVRVEDKYLDYIDWAILENEWLKK